jgi:hypothetical protein
MNMDRKHTELYKMTDNRNVDYVAGTAEDRILLVWPLTKEIASLSRKHDVERRLQRHITSLIRRKG